MSRRSHGRPGSQGHRHPDPGGARPSGSACHGAGLRGRSGGDAAPRRPGAERQRQPVGEQPVGERGQDRVGRSRRPASASVAVRPASTKPRPPGVSGQLGQQLRGAEREQHERRAAASSRPRPARPAAWRSRRPSARPRPASADAPVRADRGRDPVALAQQARREVAQRRRRAGAGGCARAARRGRPTAAGGRRPASARRPCHRTTKMPKPPSAASTRPRSTAPRISEGSASTGSARTMASVSRLDGGQPGHGAHPRPRRPGRASGTAARRRRRRRRAPPWPCRCRPAATSPPRTSRRGASRCAAATTGTRPRRPAAGSATSAQPGASCVTSRQELSVSSSAGATR